jgi:hypothetical protein
VVVRAFLSIVIRSIDSLLFPTCRAKGPLADKESQKAKGQGRKSKVETRPDKGRNSKVEIGSDFRISIFEFRPPCSLPSAHALRRGIASLPGDLGQLGDIPSAAQRFDQKDG